MNTNTPTPTVNPNDWADPDIEYTVVVRLPKAGERCLTGAKITTMTQDMDFSKYPVIVAETKVIRKIAGITFYRETTSK
jgi:hypothetical protein